MLVQLDVPFWCRLEFEARGDGNDFIDVEATCFFNSRFPQLRT